MKTISIKLTNHLYSLLANDFLTDFENRQEINSQLRHTFNQIIEEDDILDKPIDRTPYKATSYPIGVSSETYITIRQLSLKHNLPLNHIAGVLLTDYFLLPRIPLNKAVN